MSKNFISLKEKLNENELLEFDYNKNIKKPEEISYGSAEKLFWKCKLNHSYKMSANKKTNMKNGCSYCASIKVLEGFNDLATTHPNLAKEWSKDNELKPSEVMAGSNKKYIWEHIVEKDGKEFLHKWEATLNSRKQGANCPICANQKVLEGFNDFATTHPNLLTEWSKENKIKPTEILAGSNTKIIWEHSVEKNGKKFLHKWDASLSSRAFQGSNCPYCSNQKILKGYNDLKSLRPDLMKEWDFEKNTIKPTEIALNSPKKVHWKHSVNVNGKIFEHSWEAVVYSRTNGGKNCPYCAGVKVQEGFNDFASRYPSISKEWDYSLNEKKPSEVSYGSNLNVNWICPKNHKYKARIHDRKQGDGCPTCSKRLRVSIPEKIIYYYIKQLFPDTIPSYKADWLGRNELDMFIPSLNVGIEYDGQRWHIDKYNHDLEKNKLCKDNRVKLYRVREPKCPKLNISNIYELKTLKKEELVTVLKEIISSLEKRTRKVLKVDINIERDIENILSLLNKE